MAERDMNWLDLTALILVIIGALNWGLVGIFGFNLVAALFGEFTWLTRLVYILVGIAGVYAIWTAFKAGEHAGTRHPAARRV